MLAECKLGRFAVESNWKLRVLPNRFHELMHVRMGLACPMRRERALEYCIGFELRNLKPFRECGAANLSAFEVVFIGLIRNKNISRWQRLPMCVRPSLELSNISPCRLQV